MATRTEITDLQRGILESFGKGMWSCGKDTLNLREATASKTGLSIKSVNVSIHRCSSLTTVSF